MTSQESINSNNDPEKTSTGPLSKIRHNIFTPLKGHLLSNEIKKENYPSKPITILEEYLYTREITNEGIYDFRISQSKFRNLLRTQHKKLNNLNTPIPKIFINYHIFHYIISFQKSNNKIIDKNVYSIEYLNKTYFPDKNRYQISKKLSYFPPNDHDLDTYKDFNLEVQLIQFHLGQFIFEIIVDKNFICPPNLWIKLISTSDLDHTWESASFTVRKIINQK